MLRSIDPNANFSAENLPCVIRFRSRFWVGVAAIAAFATVGVLTVAGGSPSLGAAASGAGLVLVITAFLYTTMVRPRIVLTREELILYPAVRPSVRAPWISIRSVEEVEGELVVFLTDATTLTLPDLSPGRGTSRSEQAMPELVHRLNLIKHALTV